jgi:hypothetical protein
MKMVYWEIPLKRDWSLYGGATSIPIIQKANKKVVLRTVSRTDTDLNHARSIVKLHNQHVKAQLETQKVKNGNKEIPGRLPTLHEVVANAAINLGRNN